MFELNDKGNPDVVPHPFTAPKPEDLDKLEHDIYGISTDAYDIVLNGHDAGGGSIRIHDIDVQKKILDIIGISGEEAETQFGFLLDALQYGTPPHGGLALGLDRMVMLFPGLDSIRAVITFPKTQKATCLLTGAPTEFLDDQLFELSIETLQKDE